LTHLEAFKAANLFKSSSWKINIGGDGTVAHLGQFGSLLPSYYPPLILGDFLLLLLLFFVSDNIK
jgi:hypothetical protein